MSFISLKTCNFTTMHHICCAHGPAQEPLSSSFWGISLKAAPSPPAPNAWEQYTTMQETLRKQFALEQLGSSWLLLRKQRRLQVSSSSQGMACRSPQMEQTASGKLDLVSPMALGLCCTWHGHSTLATPGASWAGGATQQVRVDHPTRSHVSPRSSNKPRLGKTSSHTEGKKVWFLS